MRSLGKQDKNNHSRAQHHACSGAFFSACGGFAFCHVDTPRSTTHSFLRFPTFCPRRLWGGGAPPPSVWGEWALPAVSSPRQPVAPSLLGWQTRHPSRSPAPPPISPAHTLSPELAGGAKLTP